MRRFWVYAVVALAITSACRPEPTEQEQAYNDCMRESLAAFAGERIANIPDTAYSRAIRTCDHLDPHYHQDAES